MAHISFYLSACVSHVPLQLSFISLFSFLFCDLLVQFSDNDTFVAHLKSASLNCVLIQLLNPLRDKQSSRFIYELYGAAIGHLNFEFLVCCDANVSFHLG